MTRADDGSNIGDTNLHAEIFPTYSVVKHAKTTHEISNFNSNSYNQANRLSSSSSLSSMVSSTTASSMSNGDSRKVRYVFVLVVDACTPGDDG
ncbi:hypothetical protein EV2_000269 [Malus domestica]